MKRYLNKAIIYKEFKGSWWITLVLLFLVLSNGRFEFYDLLSRLQCSDAMRDSVATINGVSRFITDTKVLPLIIVVLIIISQTIMGSDKKGDFERIAAMPFTRKETIVSKLVVGELLLVIPLIINFIMILSMYFSNYAIIHPYIKLGIIVKLLILNLLNYSAILTFLILIQSISGKKIIGSVLGAIFMFVPIGLVLLITFFSAMHLEKFKVTVNISQSVIDKVACYLLVPLYNQLNMINIEGSYPARVIILICLICIFIALTYYSYKKNQFDRTGNVLMFSFLEPIFKIGVAVCFALTGFVFTHQTLVEFRYKWHIQGGGTLIIADLVSVVIGVLAYFLTNKYIKANRD